MLAGMLIAKCFMAFASRCPLSTLLLVVYVMPMLALEAIGFALGQTERKQ